MALFKWRESYETGVSAMDEQHKKLIEIINKLYLALRDKESQTIIQDVLEEMNTYAEQHFRQEEVLLKESNYPEYENHVASHQSYRDKLKTLIGDSKKEETQVQEVYTFLRHWWMDHIVGEDKKYGEFLDSSDSSN